MSRRLTLGPNRLSKDRTLGRFSCTGSPSVIRTKKTSSRSSSEITRSAAIRSAKHPWNYLPILERAVIRIEFHTAGREKVFPQTTGDLCLEGFGLRRRRLNLGQNLLNILGVREPFPLLPRYAAKKGFQKSARMNSTAVTAPDTPGDFGTLRQSSSLGLRS